MDDHTFSFCNLNDFFEKVSAIQFQTTSKLIFNIKNGVIESLVAEDIVFTPCMDSVKEWNEGIWLQMWARAKEYQECTIIASKIDDYGKIITYRIEREGLT